MGSRLDLHILLEGILRNDHVYFQPPPSVMMQYPAILYSLKDIDKENANNSAYIKSRSYELILIDENPDSEFVDKIVEQPLCAFDRHYVADNLNHWIFTIFF